MEYTHLGRSGLSVSRLCLGTMNFGWKTEESDAHDLMDRALAEGVNFFDTANVYGFDAGKGRTEEVLGTWFARGGERREKTVLATKVYGSMSDWPNDTFLSARNLVRSCEASLRRMQTDWIDLYQFHHVDLSTPWEEIWQACETLVAQGKVLYVGSSNHAAWQLAAATRRPPAGTSRAWSASSPTTTCSPGTWSWRCCRPRSTTASASSRGARWRRACWPASSATRPATAATSSATASASSGTAPRCRPTRTPATSGGTRRRTSGSPGCCTGRR